RFAGEQWDSDLGFYYLRARYLNPGIGRFQSADSFQGNQSDPISLHRYLYADADPVNGIDPSGNMTVTEVMVTVAARVPFIMPTLYVAQRAAARINIVSLANAFRSLFWGVGNQISRVPVNLQTGQQFERILNPAMRLLGGIKGQSVQALYRGT